MPIIKKSQVHNLTQQANELANKVPVKRTFPKQDFLTLFWTDNQMKAVETIKLMKDDGFIVEDNIGNRVENLNVNIRLTHPVLAPEPFDASLTLVVRSVERMIWPNLKRQLVSHDHPTHLRLERAVGELVEDAIGKGAFISTCEWLLKNCRTYEQARYMFPPFIEVVRLVASDIANEVENIAKVPSLPASTHFNRLTMRVAMQWYAEQVLLGSFDRRITASVPADELEISIPWKHGIPVPREGNELELDKITLPAG